ncbi:unnamed protein product [Staurois parvus]|uniref:Uncharacterized protein n=1 Tax=Staurois parvus TaxID=386267 RepID=A0ABN9BT13_9NEOB|nr:unnamed protein product [Staurois parvus]
MDPTRSQLDSDFSPQDTPCLIVEDSQPESLGTEEDDLDRARFGLLPQHLSNLQSNVESPVLEYVQGCPSNKLSFGDKECMEINELSKENHKDSVEPMNTPGGAAALSQVIERIPCPANTISNFNCDESIEPEEAAKCSTQSLEAEEFGTSQLTFGALELSQSQDIDSQHSRTDDESSVPHPKPQTLECIQEEPENDGAETYEKEKVTTHMDEDPKRNQETGIGKMSCNVDEKNTSTALEDQLKESSVAEPLCSKTEDEEMDVSDLASSQEDMFGHTDVSVSPIVSKIVSTPAESLRLLHFSGQASLPSVSVTEVPTDLASPSPDDIQPTPIIVPSSPTGQHEEVEDMDTSVPSNKTEVDVQPQIEATGSKSCPFVPVPQVSTPVCQSVPTFVSGSFAVPSQPEFSHDVFIPTPSLEDSPSREKPHQLQFPKGEEDQKALDLKLELSEDLKHTEGEVTDDCNLLLSTSEPSELLEVGQTPEGADGGATQIEVAEETSHPSLDQENQTVCDPALLANKGDLSANRKLPSSECVDLSDKNNSKVVDCITITCSSESQALLVPSLDSDASLSILDQHISDQKSTVVVDGVSDDVEEVPETPCEKDSEDYMVTESEHEKMEGNLNLALSETQHPCKEDVEPLDNEEAMEVDQEAPSPDNLPKPVEGQKEMLPSENDAAMHMETSPSIVSKVENVPAQTEMTECNKSPTTPTKELHIDKTSADQKANESNSPKDKSELICQVGDNPDNVKSECVVPLAIDCNISVNPPQQSSYLPSTSTDFLATKAEKLPDPDQQHCALLEGSVDMNIMEKETQQYLVPVENKECIKQNRNDTVSVCPNALKPQSTENADITVQAEQKLPIVEAAPDVKEDLHGNKNLCGFSKKQANETCSVIVIEDTQELADSNQQEPILAKDVPDSGQKRKKLNFL